MSSGNIINDLRYQIRSGGMTVKLIAINVIIFLSIQVISLIAFLFEAQGEMGQFLRIVFIASNDPWHLVTRPWTIITYMFTHFTFFHILFNMILLYFTGRMFEQFYGPKRVLSTYLLGGISGLFLQLLAYNIFPVFANNTLLLAGGVLGASGAVMAIFIGLAFYAPNMRVMLFGVFPVQLKWIALFFFLMDFIGLQKTDGVAHFAHVGGGIFGALTVLNSKKGGTFMLRFENWFDKLINTFKSLFRSQPKMKVYKNNPTSSRKSNSTQGSNERKSPDDEVRVDAILDKISASGYDSLTKEEKEFLFSQSRKNQR